MPEKVEIIGDTEYVDYGEIVVKDGDVVEVGQNIIPSGAEDGEYFIADNNRGQRPNKRVVTFNKVTIHEGSVFILGGLQNLVQMQQMRSMLPQSQAEYNYLI